VVPEASGGRGAARWFVLLSSGGGVTGVARSPGLPWWCHGERLSLKRCRARRMGSRGGGFLRASVRMGRLSNGKRPLILYIRRFVYLGLGLTFADGPLSSSRLFRLTEAQNRINLPNFGSRETGTELITEFFGSSSFGFGSGSFGLVFSFWLNLPRVTRGSPSCQRAPRVPRARRKYAEGSGAPVLTLLGSSALMMS
jgi:hypothetical protein